MCTTCVLDARVVAGLRATVDYESCEEQLGMLHLNGIFTVPTKTVMILDGKEENQLDATITVY
jgi:hypothetical protein